MLSSCPFRSTFFWIWTHRVTQKLDQNENQLPGSYPPGSPPRLFFLSPQMTPRPGYVKRKLSSFLRTLFLLSWSVPQPNDYIYYWPFSYESLCLWLCLILFPRVWIRCIAPLNDISTLSLTMVLPLTTVSTLTLEWRIDTGVLVLPNCLKIPN